jgi:hypothetical protein
MKLLIDMNLSPLWAHRQPAASREYSGRSDQAATILSAGHTS